MEPTRTVRDVLASLVRTAVPYGVGLVLAWLARKYDIIIDETSAAGLSATLAFVAGSMYYVIVRALEARVPALGWLLGAGFAANVREAVTCRCRPFLGGGADLSWFSRRDRSRKPPVGNRGLSHVRPLSTAAISSLLQLISAASRLCVQYSGSSARSAMISAFRCCRCIRAWWASEAAAR